MESKTTNKEQGCVVLLDALGMKGIWQKQDPKDVINAWNRVVDSNTSVILKDDSKYNVKTRIRAFSDTLMITKTGKSIEKIVDSTLLDLVTIIPYSMSHGIFFRGCISFGEFYSSEKIIIGPAIDEAAQYYELPQWIGVSATPSFFNLIENSSKFQQKDRLTKWDIPLKQGIEKKGWVINWTEAVDSKAVSKHLFKTKNKISFEQILNTQLQETNDLRASLKIRNTIEFLRHMRTK